MISARWEIAAAWFLLIACAAAGLFSDSVAAEPLEICRAGKPQAYLIAPQLPGPTSQIVSSTLNGFLRRWYGWQLPMAREAAAPGTYVVAGNQQSNAVLRELAAEGLELDDVALGDEGFRILSHETDQRRFIVVHAKTAVGLKHGCQELAYFRIAASGDSASLPWPLDVTMQPAFAYRGCYMLPCWSAYDSLASWRRALQFNSELTLNRTWFWLNGFPLLPQYGGTYPGTDLGDLNNVRSLIELCHNEGMKFYIGGGWFTWHHKESSGGAGAGRVARVGAGGGEAPLAADDAALAAGIQYYLALLAALPDADGLYLEPTGEGAEAAGEVWRKHVDALARLLQEIDRKRPEFEVAVAIGRFNSSDYRSAMHALAPEKMYWFWAWGDPLEDKALAEHPLVLRWHTSQVMSPFHGSSQPPQRIEKALTGLVTSFDPGMGFGNPWNGWAKIGVDQARNFDPYTMPYFSHQYWFRERCWNPDLSESQFAARLSKRLFDADMPAESIDVYLELAALCPQPERADREAVARIDAFVRHHADRGTLRNRDTLARMQEAIAGVQAAQHR
ncbi:MAG: hypothetical protein ACTHOU_21105 [Aureliella sp.]